MNQRPRIDISRTEAASEEELPLAVVGQYSRLDGLYRYWLGKRGGRRMPPRREMLPEEMREFLGYIVLIDVTSAPRLFRFRLLGTEIVTSYGVELTGKYTDAVRPPRTARRSSATTARSSTRGSRWCIACVSPSIRARSIS